MVITKSAVFSDDKSRVNMFLLPLWLSGFTSTYLCIGLTFSYIKFHRNNNVLKRAMYTDTFQIWSFPLQACGLQAKTLVRSWTLGSKHYG